MMGLRVATVGGVGVRKRKRFENLKGSEERGNRDDTGGIGRIGQTAERKEETPRETIPT